MSLMRVNVCVGQGLICGDHGGSQEDYSVGQTDRNKGKWPQHMEVTLFVSCISIIVRVQVLSDK